MTKIYYEKDADLGLIQGKTIGIIGFGSQGHAHALNLRDSGLNVMVGLYPGSKSWQQAQQAGLRVGTAEEVAREADIIMILAPDQVQRQIYYESIEPGLTAGKMLMFAHGFNIHFNQIVPPSDVDVTMIAPKAPGHKVRETFLEGNGTPGIIAVHQNATENALQMALAYGKGVGCARAGIIETTFEEETETDLFGEQVVLCGGVTSLVKTAFETLVQAGYQPEIAYFECMHELKLLVDMMHEGGMAYMRYSISDTAEYGDYTRGPKIIDDHVRQNMKQVLQNIRSGAFAREWVLENQAGRPSFLALRKQNQDHMIERVGADLRSMMPWLKPKSAAPATQTSKPANMQTSAPVASSMSQAPAPGAASAPAPSQPSYGSTPVPSPAPTHDDGPSHYHMPQTDEPIRTDTPSSLGTPPVETPYGQTTRPVETPSYLSTPPAETPSGLSTPPEADSPPGQSRSRFGRWLGRDSKPEAEEPKPRSDATPPPPANEPPRSYSSWGSERTPATEADKPDEDTKDSETTGPSERSRNDTPPGSSF